MSANAYQTLLLTFAVCLVGTGSVALADEGCCAHCGGAQPCQKVCRLVCGEKKVDVVCWGCKCEDFCVPCRSEKGCKNCETVCDECGETGDSEVCAKSKKFVWFDWLPAASGKIYTRTKLMKKVETVTVPSYKWVVEDLCPQCAANTAAAEAGTIVQSPAAADERNGIFGVVRLPSLTTK